MGLGFANAAGVLGTYTASEAFPFSEGAVPRLVNVDFIVLVLAPARPARPRPALSAVFARAPSNWAVLCIFKASTPETVCFGLFRTPRLTQF